MTLDHIEVRVVRHALGLGADSHERTWGPYQRRRWLAYRNYYNCDQGSAEDAAWQRLVSRGLAVTWCAKCVPGVFYAATQEGARAVLQAGERLSAELHFPSKEASL